jgi:hypothetical protein
MSQTWTFRRGDERLTLQRHDEEQDLALVITREDGYQSIPFSEFDALVTFQENMEQFLIRTGWSLATFAPDQRRYRDRRTFPRIEHDRRRWWTDSQEDQFKAEPIPSTRRERS